MQYQVRDMSTTDLPEVLKIETHMHISPWSRLAFEQSISSGHFCRVCFDSKQIIGFHVCQHIVDELHILNIVVTSDFQGKGYAHRLLHDIMGFAQDNRCKKIFLEVRESNERARSLYKKWDFEQISIRKSYYNTDQNDRESALVMVKVLDF